MSPTDAPSSRRVEEASLNAWPALQQFLLDGWVLRFARGFTKRANSVVPLYPSAEPHEAKIRYCENLYARERLTPIFRLTSLGDHAALDALLERRGYRRADPTLVLTCPLAPAPAAGSGEMSALTQAEWLALYAAITDAPPAATQLHALLLNAIRTEHRFAAVRAADPARTYAACGLGVAENALLGIFDVATRDTLRRCGYGRTLVESLLRWGAGAGARHAYLQVLEDNAPARRLYERLGFEPLYAYWYRLAPG
jgi:GNAT superfamily N-acetyltransferase